MLIRIAVQMPQYWMDSSFCGFHDESLDDDWKVFTEPQLTSSEEDSSDMDGTCHTNSPLPLKATKVGICGTPPKFESASLI